MSQELDELKKINIAKLKKLASEASQPFPVVFMIAVIQIYLGGLERVLQFLMANLFVLWLVVMVKSSITAESVLAVLFVIWSCTISFGGVFACLYIEYLYTSKGSSFFTSVTGLSRLLCPHKNADHRREELNKSVEAVTSVKELHE